MNEGKGAAMNAGASNSQGGLHVTKWMRDAGLQPSLTVFGLMDSGKHDILS